MKDRESWKSKFCSKCVSDCPNWTEGAKIMMCPCFHIGKYCFNGGMHAKLHVSKANILQGKVVEFKDYMKTVRNKG
eukprot:8325535-Ditylum_brightwellii.AAC.1